MRRKQSHQAEGRQVTRRLGAARRVLNIDELHCLELMRLGLVTTLGQFKRLKRNVCGSEIELQWRQPLAPIDKVRMAIIHGIMNPKQSEHKQGLQKNPYYM